ncbi:uncharacterized protein LOC134823615 [Bolinopsis microptera]|uniref:uncharacterized protein LOC134823615 n=1 Tax=Bolinopsis microptera TaxID=2820187 RepID=UPI0030798A6D
MVRVYKLDRLKMTKELLAIEKSAAICRRDNFDKYKYPCFWDPDVPSIVEGYKPVVIGHVSRAKAKEPAPMLYGEEPSAFLPPTRDHGNLRRCSSESSLESNLDTASQIMEGIRRIQVEACSRQPKQLVKKVITMGRFVNEFEWLDTKHTQWFMDNTVKVFHKNLMADMRREAEKERLEKVMLLAERNKGFNTDVYRRSLNVVDKDVKYSEKEGRLLAKSLDILSKDARRVSRNMDAEQRNLIRRSTSVHAKTDISYSSRRITLSESPSSMPHTNLYGEANTFTNSCSNLSRYSYRSQSPEDPVRKISGSSKYSDNMMNDLRLIANRALSDLDKTKPTGRDRSNSWGIIKRESMKERKNSKADNLLQQNISRWHNSYQRAANTSPGSNESLKMNKALDRSRKTGYTADMNRSYSCDLPRIEGDRPPSRLSRRSEPVIALNKYSPHHDVYLPNIGK